MSTVLPTPRPIRHVPLGHRIGHALEALRQGRAVVLHDAVYVVGGSPTPEASHASQGSAIVERFSSACSRNTPH